jgi:hypothetical protein
MGNWFSSPFIECVNFIGRNAKLSGSHGQEVWFIVVDSLNPILRTMTPDWSMKDREDLVWKVKQEILDTKLHLYSEMYIPTHPGRPDHADCRHCVIARKPPFME